MILKLMKEYKITNIKLLTSKIIKLATYMREPTKQELNECIENFEMVIEYSKKRNRDDLNYDTQRIKAAIRIQKFFRSWASRRYLEKLLITKQKL